MNNDATVIADLNRRFNHHPPKGDAASRHALAREACRNTAAQICAVVPPGREQSLALTKLEEAMFWANAGIARLLSAPPLEAPGLQAAVSSSDPAPTPIAVSNPVPG